MGTIQELYEQRMPKKIKSLHQKFEQAGVDIQAGNLRSQAEVEKYFQSKFGR